jgi:uncharacterized protein (PEP-CTERM system associated)
VAGFGPICGGDTRSGVTRLGLTGLGFGAGLGFVLSCGAAQAQLLPSVGPDLRVGDLRSQFDQAFNGPLGASGVELQGWQVNYGLQVSETFDDGIILPNGRIASDLITQISPFVTIQAATARLQGTLYYAPQLNLFTFHGNQTNIGQNLNASATATVVPDLFFVDLRGFAGQQSAYGGQGTLASSQSSGNNQVQTTSFSVRPYLQHKFSGIGTAMLGYTLTQSMTDASQVNSNTSNSPFFIPINSNRSLTNEGHFNFTTGDEFGRFNHMVDALASQSQGTGVQNGSRQSSAYYQLSYATTRDLTLNGSLGYEDIYYSNVVGSPPLHIHGLTYNAGFRWTPDPDTFVSLSYGRQQGNNAFNLDSGFAPTARSRIYLRYSQGVGTQLDQLQNSLAATRATSSGVSIDPTTGAPVVIGNNFFNGNQLAVYRTTTASATAALNYDRDTFSLTLEHDDQVVLAGGAPVVTSSGISTGGATSSSGFTGSLVWSHSVSEAITASAAAEYGTRTAPFQNFAGFGNGSNNQTTLSFNVTVSYALSPTLSTSAQYTRIDISGNTFGQAANRDIATVRLTKTF